MNQLIKNRLVNIDWLTTNCWLASSWLVSVGWHSVGWPPLGWFQFASFQLAGPNWLVSVGWTHQLADKQLVEINWLTPTRG